MDLDGDGIKDMISGCYWTVDGRQTRKGEIYFFAGLGGGRYAASTRLTDANGKTLQISEASSVAIVDWDRDGTLDLVCAFSHAPVKFLKGLGQLTFGDPVDLTTRDGIVIQRSEAGVAVGDWDSDGIPDLILGAGNGEVVFYKAIQQATGKLPTLEPEIQLIPPAEMLAELAAPEGLEILNPRSRGRAKPAVADWNGDGKSDLLVGDCVRIGPYKTSEEVAVLRGNEARHRALEGLYRAQLKEIEAEVARAMGFGSFQEVLAAGVETANRFYRATQESRDRDPSVQAWAQEMRKLEVAIAPFKKTVTHGFVWVYLRR